MSTAICIHGNDPMTCDQRPDGRCHVPKRPCPECGKDATEVCVHMQRLLAAIEEPRMSTDDGRERLGQLIKQAFAITQHNDSGADFLADAIWKGPWLAAERLAGAERQVAAIRADTLRWYTQQPAPIGPDYGERHPGDGWRCTVDMSYCGDMLSDSCSCCQSPVIDAYLAAALGVTPTSKTPATAVDTRIKPSHHGSGNDETAAVAGPNNPLAPCCCAVSNGYDWIYATNYSHCGACVAGHHDKCTAVGAVPVDEPPAETNNQNAHIRDNPSEGVPA